jgi:hypothetical protein
VWGVTHLLQRTGDIEPEPAEEPGDAPEAARSLRHG